MTGVATRAVAPDEAGLRLDRWFRRHYPQLSHGHLEKLLRKGQVRVDGRRAKAGQRLDPGQAVRVPPLPEPVAGDRKRPPPPVTPADAGALLRAVIWRDDEVIALDKPPGLAVQGGTGVTRNLDAMLDALRYGLPDRPRLVHRLDRDTSGVLLLGRTPAAAAWLAAAFRARKARKLYWALVAGVPRPARGSIDMPLLRTGGHGVDKVVPEPDAGRRATTRYAVVEAAGRRVAWLAVMPLTGRTHQIRVHLASIGHPVLGDGKYGGAEAFPGGIARRLHLHAREIAVERPDGSVLRAAAPLSAHMRESFALFGFDPDRAEDPFADDDQAPGGPGPGGYS